MSISALVRGDSVTILMGRRRAVRRTMLSASDRPGLAAAVAIAAGDVAVERPAEPEVAVRQHQPRSPGWIAVHARSDPGAGEAHDEVGEMPDGMRGRDRIVDRGATTPSLRCPRAGGTRMPHPAPWSVRNRGEPRCAPAPPGRDPAIARAARRRRTATPGPPVCRSPHDHPSALRGASRHPPRRPPGAASAHPRSGRSH